jgi:hypothetical protein
LLREGLKIIDKFNISMKSIVVVRQERIARGVKLGAPEIARRNRTPATRVPNPCVQS